MKSSDKFFFGAISFLAIVCLMVIFSLPDVRMEEGEVILNATVISRKYIPSRSETSYGPAMGFDGEFRNRWSTKHIPEKHLVVFESQGGNTYEVNNSEYFEGLEVGDSLQIVLSDSFRVTYEGDVERERELLGSKFSHALLDTVNKR